MSVYPFDYTWLKMTCNGNHPPHPIKKIITNVLSHSRQHVSGFWLYLNVWICTCSWSSPRKQWTSGGC